MRRGHPRWKATVYYLTEGGELDVVHYIEEIEDLHDVIERGPSWDTIKNIDIRLNNTSRQTTIEQSLKE